MLALPLGVLIGLVMPLQTSANSRLRLSVGSPFLASFISFLVGTLTLLVATLLVDGGLPDLGLAAGQPGWLWAGGFLGVVVLTGNIFLFPRLGSVQTVVLPITGQVLMGLLIDHFGWFHSPQAPLSATRVAGAVLLVVGVLGAIGLLDTLVRRRTVAPVLDGGRGEGAGLWLWRAAGVVFGMCGATQTAVNGRLGVVIDSAVAAALVSFTVGVTTLLLIVLATRTPWRLRRLDGRPNPWWMWIGGFLGAAFVFGNAFLAPIIGTGLTVMVILLGLMGGSLIIDHFGLLGARRKPTTALQALGLLLMVAGVALIRLV
ncbi:DMT family transporter [Corynebacterium halotolerans]|uniref:DMT family transporter n=1 Tax=Corynebacterium halotolerans TaxID=225326 RepID=UPI000345E44E|nr:DMT family transporter [Corynebacterium halotolerans]